ncbi:MAG: Gfo/Idh/MocA family oxidoreductase [Patescibacteria group bacterium]|jgi:predicted dehydrogenase
MNKNIKVAVIGFGKRGKTHLQNYLKINGVRVVAICDVKKCVTTHQNIVYYRDYKKMIDLEKPDVVSICVPTSEHYPIALHCLKKGINVLCEKPITLTLTQAERLLSVVRKNKLVMQVGYHLKFDNLIIKLKSIIDSRELGKILMIKARQSHDWGGLKPFGWLLNKLKSGGGTIIDNASHYLNLFEYLLGDIDEIHAFANNLSFGKAVEDNAIITVKFRKYILGEIETSWLDSSGRNNQLLVYGDKAVAEYRETNAERILEIKRYRQDKDEWNRLVREDIYLPKGIEQLGKKDCFPAGEKFLFESTENMLRLFIGLLEEKKQRGELKRAIRTLKLVQSAYKSIKTKRAIKIV